MHQSINKYKLFLYIFFFIFLSSIFNFKILKIYQNKFKLKNINISGLSYHEKKNIQIELDKFKNINIFKIDKEKLNESFNNFDFLENVSVNKIIPSALDISLTKTSILGKTLINGEMFYIGANRKFINSNQLFEINNDVAMVFGNFKIDEYLDLLEILKDYKLNIKNIVKYYYYKNKRWDLLFSNGHTLMLPSKNINESIKIYKKLSDNQTLINVKIVDLRIFNQIILTKNNE